MNEQTAQYQMVALGDVSLNVLDTGGDGRPVVLIHGWPLSGASWEHQISVLAAEGYRVIAYDRRGFGMSDKPSGGYDYDTFTADLDSLLTTLDLHDVTLIGFSMGGGEVARYVSTFGQDRLHSVVFASAVPPLFAKTDDNPDGPLDSATAEQMASGLSADREAFFDQFTKDFFSANGTMMVSEDERQAALELALQSDKTAALEAMNAFATTDFRPDLPAISLPTLVIHGDADGIVPFDGSGRLTHKAIAGSELHVVAGGPHGINVSHADEFNKTLIDFLQT